jgi:hypothetical protein
MRAIYDLDNTILSMTPKWIGLMYKREELAAKILKKFPNYEKIKNRIDEYLDDYKLHRLFGFSESEHKLMKDALDDCEDFYQEWTDIEMPDFGIKGISEIAVISMSDGDSKAALSKRRLLEDWKKQGKISGWEFTGYYACKAKYIAESQKYRDYDFIAEDHVECPIQICRLMEDMKVHMVEYPYNRRTVEYLKLVYPWRLI